MQLETVRAKSLSWFDSQPLMQREALLRDAGRSYFTFEELIDQYVSWLESRVMYWEKIKK